MEEYLKKVMEQIRCKKVHSYIERELRDHMEDQIQVNVSDGMSQEEAVAAAVKDMGDPVEAGMMLDRVHRPQIAWKMLLLIGMLSIAGVFIHTMIRRLPGTEGAVYDMITSSSRNYLKYVCIGILIMTALCWMDYTRIVRFSRIVAAAMIAIGFISLRYGLQINGASGWIKLEGVILPVHSLMLLYVPVYGGVLYTYYAKGYKGLLAAVVWMMIPVFQVLRMPSVVNAFLMLISMLVMLTAALKLDWFKVSGKFTVAALWLAVGGLPLLGFAVSCFRNGLQSYQVMRIKAFLTNSGEANYLTGVVRELLSGSKFVGNSGVNVVDRVADANSDYLLTYLSSTYGLLAAIAVCGVLAALIFYIFWISRKQSNQLGMIMGIGCGMIFIVSFVLNILVNMGAVPPTTTFLPFLSAGGGQIIVSYALAGVILSVYRFKNIYPRHSSLHQERTIEGVLPKFSSRNISNG